VIAAPLTGATRIVAVDVVPSRLELALELGATDAIDASSGEVVAAIRERTRYGVDFSFNTTRSPAVFTQAMECLAPRGVAGFVGAPLGAWTPDMFQILSGGRTLRGILGGDSSPGLFIPLLMEYYRQGRLPFDRLIRFYPLQDIAQAFADCERGTTIKAVLRM
jgi:aryl-alcohol dehydrogenase